VCVFNSIPDVLGTKKQRHYRINRSEIKLSSDYSIFGYLLKLTMTTTDL